MSDVVYTPPKSLVPFLTSEKFIALQVGPVGSTKTTAGIMKIAYHAKQMAPCEDGVRRSRAIWVRRSRQMLFDTSIKDFLSWYPDGTAGSFSKTDAKFDLKFDDVHCEVLFRPMEDESDINRLLSLQGSFAIFDEFREISPAVFEAMQGRLGRYPDKRMVPPRPEWGVDNKGHPVGGCVTDDGKPNKHLWGMTNPPDADTYWETLLTNPPENTDVFFQPSGMSPEADWLQFLPDEYYENLAQGKSQDYIDVYIHSKFGRSLSGQPVFKSFNRETHVAKTALRPIGASAPLLIGVDAGLTPAATVGQVTHDGRVVIYDALVSEDMGALRFVREKLKPLLVNKFPGYKPLVVIDPAAFQRVQTDERTVADIYKAEGFLVRPAKTNSIAARISAVDKFLTRVVDGKNGMLFCPEGAKSLVQALAGKYRYKVNTKGERDEAPEKSHPWSDACFIAGTPILTPAGYAPVEALRVGDVVMTHDGVDRVVAIGNRVPEELIELVLSDGSVLTCTPDHPFAVNNHTCFLPADMLTCKHKLVSVEEATWANGQSRTRESNLFRALASSVEPPLRPLRGVLHRAKASIAAWLVTALDRGLQTGLSMTGCGLPGRGRTAITGINAQTLRQSHFTGMCGSSTMARYLRGMWSTMLTTTLPTMALPTYKYCLAQNMRDSICKRGSRLARWTWTLRLKKRAKQQKCGIAPMRAASGTGSMLTVVSTRRVPPQQVFNLTTERSHMYFAGPALVHNCDALQYLCLQADGGEVFGQAITAQKREVKRVSARGWT